jgi:putative ABC transport system permease protein
VGTADLLMDLRIALRRQARKPGVWLGAALALGLGVGVSAAMFTVAWWVVLRPVEALQRSHHVVMSGNSMLPGDARTVARQQAVFGGAALFRSTFVFPAGSTEPKALFVTSVGPGFFPLLNVAPALGRSFLPSEYWPGHDGEVLLSYSLWQRRFGGSRDALGRSFELGGGLYTVVGVLPKWFRFRDPAFGTIGKPTGAWVPLVLTAADLSERGEPRFGLDGEPVGGVLPLRVIASLRRGVSLAEANRRLQAIASAMAAENPTEKYLAENLQLIRPRAWLVQWSKKTLWLLFGASCLVLLIACANLTALLALAAASRAREMALREALGASRFRLLRLALCESLTVALAGAAVAVLAALAGVRLFHVLTPVGEIARLEGVRIGAWTVGFALLVAALVAVVATVLAVPGRARRPISLALRERSSGWLRAAPDGASGWLRTLLVAGQVAMATVLLVAAGLISRSLWSMSEVRPGFDYRHVLVSGVGPAAGAWARIPPDEVRQDLAKLLAGLQSTPGVSAAALATDVFPWPGVVGFSAEEPTQSPQIAASVAWWQRVTNGYFALLRIPLLEGRLFSQSPVGPPAEALINRTLAREYFPSSDPVGRTLRVNLSFSYGPSSAEAVPVRIVGVVGDVRAGGLDRPVRPEIYTPILSNPSIGASILLRGKVDGPELSRHLRSLVAAVDNRMFADDFEPFRAQIEQDLATRRFLARLNGIFAVVALTLALVGLYGLLAYNVRLRTAEIAVRRALGAQDGQILSLVLGAALLLVLCGAGVGALAAAGLVRLARAWFYGVSPADPWTYVGVGFALLATGLLSAYVPARRALKVDPAIVLREE